MVRPNRAGNNRGGNTAGGLDQGQPGGAEAGGNLAVAEQTGDTNQENSVSITGELEGIAAATRASEAAGLNPDEVAAQAQKVARDQAAEARNTIADTPAGADKPEGGAVINRDALDLPNGLSDKVTPATLDRVKDFVVLANQKHVPIAQHQAVERAVQLLATTTDADPDQAAEALPTAQSRELYRALWNKQDITGKLATLDAKDPATLTDEDKANHERLSEYDKSWDNRLAEMATRLEPNGTSSDTPQPDRPVLVPPLNPMGARGDVAPPSTETRSAGNAIDNMTPDLLAAFAAADARRTEAETARQATEQAVADKAAADALARPEGAPSSVVVDRDEALRMARAEDPLANEQYAKHDEFQKLIDRSLETVPLGMRKQMETRFKERRAAELRQLNAEQVIVTDKLIDQAQESFVHASRHEASRTTITAGEDRAEVRARLQRQLLGVQGAPFMESKSGGRLHFSSRKRGPKVVESYFRAPGNENLVVVTRSNRRTGELVSQNVLTTEQGIRKSRSGEITRPPKEVMNMMDGIRNEDRLNPNKPKAKFFADTFSGYGTNGDFDKRVYGENYGTGQTPAELSQFRGKSRRRRRGGLLFWMMGNSR